MWMCACAWIMSPKPVPMKSPPEVVSVEPVRYRSTLLGLCPCFALDMLDTLFGFTCTSVSCVVLWFVGFNLLVQNHNHYCGDESLGPEPQSLLWG